MFGMGNNKVKELLHKEGTLIVDVRSKDEFTTGSYKNETNTAINIPHTEIAKLKADGVPFDKTIVVYCMAGGRAGTAKATLESLGYKDVTNAGGFSGIKNL